MNLTLKKLNNLILEVLSQDEFDTAKELLSHEGMLLYALEGLFGDLMYPEELPPAGEPDEHGFVEDPAAFHVDETFEIEDYDFGDFKIADEVSVYAKWSESGKTGEVAILVPNGPRLPEMEIIERLQKVGLDYQTKDNSIIVGNEKDLKIIKAMDFLEDGFGIKIPSGAEIVQTKYRFMASWHKEVPIQNWTAHPRQKKLSAHTVGANYVLWHDEFSVKQVWDDATLQLTSRVTHKGFIAQVRPPNEVKGVSIDIHDDEVLWQYRFYNQVGSKASNESRERKEFSTVAEAIEEAKKYLPGIEAVLNET